VGAYVPVSIGAGCTSGRRAIGNVAIHYLDLDASGYVPGLHGPRPGASGLGFHAPGRGTTDGVPVNDLGIHGPGRFRLDRVPFRDLGT
jgi:hypothetical protein